MLSEHYSDEMLQRLKRNVDDVHRAHQVVLDSQDAANHYPALDLLIRASIGDIGECLEEATKHGVGFGQAMMAAIAAVLELAFFIGMEAGKAGVVLVPCDVDHTRSPHAPYPGTEYLN